ncbi:MAG: prepilin-type N-terminal cleavage/methylation domain-containing protein [Alphaproteobacteria bacterium]|nr:prepilin-type N-terminal cleavage/methylation domain-containing protein [Alphaproteobacteria bacterium]
MHFPSTNIKGFTFIEVLIAISIVGALSGAVISGLQVSQDKAEEKKSKVELSQIIASAENYYTTYSTYTGLCSAGTLTEKLNTDILTQGYVCSVSNNGETLRVHTVATHNSNIVWCADTTGVLTNKDAVPTTAGCNDTIASATPAISTATHSANLSSRSFIRGIGDYLTNYLPGGSFQPSTIVSLKPVVALVEDTGESSTDGITNNSTVQVRNQNPAYTLSWGTGSTTIFPTTWAPTIPSITTDGTHTVYARYTNTEGAEYISNPLTFIVDTTSPTLVAANPLQYIQSSSGNVSSVSTTYTQAGTPETLSVVNTTPLFTRIAHTIKSAVSDEVFASSHTQLPTVSFPSTSIPVAKATITATGNVSIAVENGGSQFNGTVSLVGLCTPENTLGTITKNASGAITSITFPNTVTCAATPTVVFSPSIVASSNACPITDIAGNCAVYGKMVNNTFTQTSAAPIVKLNAVDKTGWVDVDEDGLIEVANANEFINMKFAPAGDKKYTSANSFSSLGCPSAIGLVGGLSSGKWHFVYVTDSTKNLYFTNFTELRDAGVSESELTNIQNKNGWVSTYACVGYEQTANTIDVSATPSSDFYTGTQELDYNGNNNLILANSVDPLENSFIEKKDILIRAYQYNFDGTGWSGDWGNPTANELINSNAIIIYNSAGTIIPLYSFIKERRTGRTGSYDYYFPAADVFNSLNTSLASSMYRIQSTGGYVFSRCVYDGTPANNGIRSRYSRYSVSNGVWTLPNVFIYILEERDTRCTVWRGPGF